MRENINGAQLKEMFLCAADALELNKQALNELNVFPVPDGDTGTNMSLTMQSAANELRKKNPATVTAVADCAASALLRGARGNSGVILSLLFRGVAKGLKGLEEATALDFASAVTCGVETAYKAVMKPAEGTILTVSRLSGDAAMDYVQAGTDFELMLVCLIEAAKDALADTVNQNPVLKKAGVVDAGGQGYVCIMEAMLASLQGKAVASAAPVQSTPTREKADFASFNTEDITFGYCTEFIIRKENDKSPDLLRAYLDSMGDSLVVVDDDEIIKVHVHTNDPGKAITEALTYGCLLTTKIENMREQHTEMGISAAEPEEDKPVEPEKKYGVVTVCAGAGMEELFRELGADAIVTGGQTMNPSTEDILSAVEKVPAEIVFVLPNNKNIIMAAEQCVELATRKVVVIPTKTVPQGISALLTMDPEAEEGEIVDTMTEIIASVHTALVTYAARDSDFDGYAIKAGEYLALMDGKLIGSFSDVEALKANISEAVQAFDPGLVTVYYGEDVSAEAAEDFSSKLEADLPDAELTVISGGQPVYYYMISAE